MAEKVSTLNSEGDVRDFGEHQRGNSQQGIR